MTDLRETISVHPIDETIDLDAVDAIIERFGSNPDSAIPILQAIQSRFRYLPQSALIRVCEKTRITPAQVAGVSTFYNQFRHKPAGQHLIRICHGTACHVKGSPLVHDALLRHLDIPQGHDTDPNGLFTVEPVACLGCCTLAPVLQIDGVTYGHLTPDTVAQVLGDFLELQSRRAASTSGTSETRPDGTVAEIRVGLGSCCVAAGSAQVHQALQNALDETGIRAHLKRVGCVGMCHQTPLVEIITPTGGSFLYARVQPADARDILLRHFSPAGFSRKARLLGLDLLDQLYEDTEPVPRYSIEVRDPPVAAFLGPQEHIATEHCGHIDPLDLDEYCAHDGFAALARCLRDRTPQQLIEDMTLSGLRGRGGAGFSTGRKWHSVSRAPGGPKIVICNGDEGDPGAFMDRMLLESYPYRVIEGMIIAARAVGAAEGILYIRSEYPLAVRRVNEAIRRCREQGFLGSNILDAGFAFDLRIFEGAGAFVCGEETALIASLEGRRGMPRFRPPYPAQTGFSGLPTLINNVETYACVPWIFRHGPEDFAKLGTTHSKGTKVFALAGKVARGGLIEVPMGVTIRQIVEEIGGGIAGGKRFKAVQVGGPSGGCVPAELADTPIDFEALHAVGAIMGSGGLVVLDESDCMVDITRYFLQFTQNQSCGKCTFCRVGTRRMLDILERLCTGQGRKTDLDELEHLGHAVKAGSLCGLGRTAPNPVLSTLRYFRDEYEAHLQGRCPAAACKPLITYSINDDCIGCTRCAQHCPVQAIAFTPYQKHSIDPDKCIRCGTCKLVCPTDAVNVK